MIIKAVSCLKSCTKVCQGAVYLAFGPLAVLSGLESLLFCFAYRSLQCPKCRGFKTSTARDYLISLPIFILFYIQTKARHERCFQLTNLRCAIIIHNPNPTEWRHSAGERYAEDVNDLDVCYIYVVYVPTYAFWRQLHTICHVFLSLLGKIMDRCTGTT